MMELFRQGGCGGYQRIHVKRQIYCLFCNSLQVDIMSYKRGIACKRMSTNCQGVYCWYELKQNITRTPHTVNIKVGLFGFIENLGKALNIFVAINLELEKPKRIFNGTSLKNPSTFYKSAGQLDRT